MLRVPRRPRVGGLVGAVESEARRADPQHDVLGLCADVSGVHGEPRQRVLAGPELGHHPAELVAEDRLAGPGRGLREHRHEVPGPMAAQQPAVLPAARHAHARWVRPAGDLVEEHQEAALVVGAREGEHPLLLLLEQPRAERHRVQRERLDRRGRARADVRRQQRPRAVAAAAPAGCSILPAATTVSDAAELRMKSRRRIPRRGVRVSDRSTSPPFYRSRGRLKPAPRDARRRADVSAHHLPVNSPNTDLTIVMLAITFGSLSTAGGARMLGPRHLVAAVVVAMLAVAGCGSDGDDAASGGGAAGEAITLGFAQVGAESGWRTANTKSIQDSAREARDRAQVLRRAAEAGEPDQGDPLLHPAEGRRDRVLARGRVRLGRGAAGGQAREDPGHPHRPRGRLPGHDALQDVPRLGLRQGGQARRRVGARGVQGHQGRGQHRRAAGHDRLGPGDRPQAGLHRRARRPTRSSRSRSPRTASSRARRARRSWRPS